LATFKDSLRKVSNSLSRVGIEEDERARWDLAIFDLEAAIKK
jgi:hypothetical protein